nr:MAG TPA: hypothetical protein [Caudoviricetes sp.]
MEGSTTLLLHLINPCGGVIFVITDIGFRYLSSNLK